MAQKVDTVARKFNENEVDAVARKFNENEDK